MATVYLPGLSELYDQLAKAFLSPRYSDRECNRRYQRWLAETIAAREQSLTGR